MTGRRSTLGFLSFGAAVALAACLGATTGPAFAEDAGAQPKLTTGGASSSSAGLTKTIEDLRKGSLTQAEFKSLDGKAVGDALSYLAGRNDAEMIKRLVALGASPDQPNSFGTNALIVAIGGDSLAAASALIAAGANPKSETARSTPLDYASKVGSIEMKALLDGKVLDAGERLRLAARKGYLEAIRELAKSGVDLNSADGQGVTPILEAAQAGNHEAVNTLLKLGAGPDGSPKAQVTPLAVAIVLGDAEMAKALLDAHAYPDMKVQGVPTLTLAVAAGRKEIVDLLLAAQADKGIKGDDGTRPADVAAVMGQSSLAQELGGSSAFKPATDLFAAIKANDEDKVKADLRAGTDPNQKNEEGYPALVYAAAFGNSRLVHDLLVAGADPTTVGPGAVSAILAAYARKDTEEAVSIAKTLLEGNPDVARRLLTMKDAKGRSAAVVMAAHARYLDDLVSFMDRAQVAQLANAQDGDGITPLEAAVLADNDDIVKEFIDAGTEPDKVKGDMSLQDLARARGSWAALARLPSDRVLPDGLEKGASQSVKKDFQSLLAQWGYYKGKVDGTFGKAALAAAAAFFKDRGKEIRKMEESGSDPIPREERPGAAPGDAKLTLAWPSEGGGCTWKVIDWNPRNRNSSASFVGCVKGGNEWNSHGIGYTVFGDGSEEILLFGDGGWKGEVQLK
ncbi:ankyrin repeat domain-containing protein [Mesorhizobium sp.]|uniref:ankyrin repeat domain-containing protein n=1 Tax=Mesorhizobium sp. TaxID=1871066 RepID=UPI0025EB4B3E|nr:ankyrin repeat domain-containing protein [Mesorhizobium sp.]